MEVIDLQDRLTYGQVYGISPERKGSGAYLPPRTFAAPTGGAAPAAAAGASAQRSWRSATARNLRKPTQAAGEEPPGLLQSIGILFLLCRE